MKQNRQNEATEREKLKKELEELQKKIEHPRGGAPVRRRNEERLREIQRELQNLSRTSAAA